MNKEPMNKQPTHSVESSLNQAQQETGVPLTELRTLMGFVTGFDRVRLITRKQQELPAENITRFDSLAHRRAQGEPIAYLIETKEFFSRPFFVDSRVLIPRPETEELVEHALALLQLTSSQNLLTRVLDIGCGSGVIGITLALENPILDITATDISADALEVAQRNANALNATNIRFIQSDLFENLLDRKPALAFDLICSNPPYIHMQDEHLSQGDLRFEPQHALTDHGDGLYFYRSIAQHSPKLLRPGASVVVEHGYDQQDAVLALFKAHGFKTVQGLRDLGGHPRIVIATLSH